MSRTACKRWVATIEWRDRGAYLSSGVDDFRREILALPLYSLAESVFYRRVIALHEVTVNELHSER